MEKVDRKLVSFWSTFSVHTVARDKEGLEDLGLFKKLLRKSGIS